MPMLEKVRWTINTRQLLPADPHVLVAVSGGADSMAMLFALQALREAFKLTITAAHLDHSIRSDSRADAAFVRRMCATFNIPLWEERVDVPALRGSSGNLEEIARDARHRFLEATAHHVGANAIALGHTRTDLVETLLLHLMRGAGPGGLRGLAASRPPYIRPLIDCARQETRAFCRVHSIPFRDDPTNADTALRRNALRLEVLPHLERFNPRSEEALARAAELWGEAQESLLWAAQRGFERVVSPEGLDLGALEALPQSVQRLVLRHAAQKAMGERHTLTRAHVDALWRLTKKGRGAAHLPGGLRAFAYRGTLRLELAPSGEPYREVLPLQGELHLPEVGWCLNAAIVPPPVDLKTVDPFVMHADLASIQPPLVTRSREPGDRMRPLGMPSPVKVTRLLSQAGIPRHNRASWPLVCDQQGIVWVVGVRLSEDHKVTHLTKEALRVEAVSER